MDSAELGALFERYGFYVQRRCELLLGSAADAEDATQEVFLRVQKYASSLKAPVTLAWLYTIATRVSYDRGQRRAREVGVEEHRLVALAGGDTEAADRRAVIAQELQSMSSKGREIALLYHVEGWTQDEVAERTGFSRKTVGKYLAGFAQTLRQRWKGAAPLRGEEKAG